MGGLSNAPIPDPYIFLFINYRCRYWIYCRRIGILSNNLFQWLLEFKPGLHASQFNHKVSCNAHCLVMTFSVILFNFGPIHTSILAIHTQAQWSMTSSYVITSSLNDRWNTLTGASTVMVTHRPLSSAVRSSDDSYWPVNSFVLSLHGTVCNDQWVVVVNWVLPAWWLLFLELWFSVAGHVGTVITCDAWQFTVRATNVWHGHWPVTIYIHLFSIHAVFGPAFVNGFFFC